MIRGTMPIVMAVWQRLAGNYEGTESFYKRLGFVHRPSGAPGMKYVPNKS